MKAKHFFIIALSALSLSLFNSCSGETIMKATMAAINTQCPLEIEEGVSITSFEFENPNLIFNVYYEDPTAISEDMKATLQESLVTTLREQGNDDPNWAKLYESLRKMDGGIIMRLSSPEQTIELEVRAEDLM